MSELKKLIGEQLRLIRESKDYSQDQVADIVAENTGKPGFNKSRVSKIESGKENIKLETLELMMHALGVSHYELFDFNKYQEPNMFADKKMMIEAHKYTLMERPMEDVQYVVRTAQDFLETLDAKGARRNKKK